MPKNTKPQKRVKLKAWAVYGKTVNSQGIMEVAYQYMIYPNKKDAQDEIDSRPTISNLLKVVPVEIILPTK